ncbi:aminotransferase class V-fold PLP-dependent enzyme [Paraburkholderia sabiae]|uniref:Aminotransferase class V-fold PLP-dependent enzyme n=1 Tax=Paraburkholderia sabiae TaxID=273251 RepID=A0ABU9QT65_9BURK|nr:aminotransferase class V-fold PLP-dependent enzyme [Paraburkholderia sabiae]WJZ79439.1 aminotransferase class V-fold PLP-dependent enzyme [Paraburkholderia sabiae]CAD6562789.1 2-aminoethylphosphonate--pyruvate transaminase [Paraburkholderia sabiae]
MEKHAILMTTGSLALSNEVKAEMQLDVDSRSLQFRLTTAFIRELILGMVDGNGTHSVVPLPGGGSYGMEAALASFVSRTDRPLVCVNGNCGEQILEIMRHRGIRARSLRTPCDRPISVNELGRCLEADPDISHVCLVHCESPTGVVNPINELVQLAKQHKVKTIVDAVNSFGALEISARRTPFDVLVTVSDKCIEAPPGISFVIASLDELESSVSDLGSLILDVRNHWRSIEKTGQWHSMPPTHVVQACKKALEVLAVEGINKRSIRYAAVSDEIVRATEKYAIPLLGPRVRSPTCVALTSHGTINSQREFDALYAHLTKYNLYIDPNLNIETCSYTIGCMGAVKPTSIYLLATAFRVFFQPVDAIRAPH